MFCNQCGAQIPDGSRFCMNCGAKLPDCTAQPAPQPTPVSSFPARLMINTVVAKSEISNEKRIVIRNAQLPDPAYVQLRRDMKDGDVLTVATDGSHGPVVPFDLKLTVVEDSFELHRTVTKGQLLRSEILEVSDPRLERPVRVPLDPDIYEGQRVQMKPGAGKSYFTPFWLTLHVVSDAQPQPQQSQYAPQPQPVYQPQPQQRYAAPQPVANEKPVTNYGGFRIGSSVAEVDNRSGGSGGAVDVYSDRMDIFKKSTGVALAFGAIGSAIEGKGKLFMTLRPEMVSQARRVVNKKGKLEYYLFQLTDGRGLRVTITGKQEAAPAIERLFRIG